MISQVSREFTKKIVDASGQNVFSCNLCGKCTAGCPISQVMDVKPHQFVRLIQLGYQKVLESKTIWLCASCLTCVSRCPKEIDIPKLMESLRFLILTSGINFLDYTTDMSDKLPLQALVAVRSKYSSVNLPTVHPSTRLKKYFIQARAISEGGYSK
jgi:heterodisulfide reductase subunit C